MSTDTIDPEYQKIARRLPRNLGRPIMVRVQSLLELFSRFSKVPEDVTVETVGERSVRVHVPKSTSEGPRPAILWLHGGGFIFGSPAQDDALCRRMADELDAIVVAAQYRLAPKHPFPAALDDAHAALVWLAARDDVDATRIAIAGASAGGGLAAQLALEARERGQVKPVLQALVYPMLDDRTVLRTDLDESGFRLWNNAGNRFGWRSYLGQEPGGPDVSPIAAPARNEKLEGLAPAWIGVGGLDLFHDEDVAYAEKLKAAGVPCQVLTIPGVFHSFDMMGPETQATQRFHASLFGALRAALGVPPAEGADAATPA